ncbi:putative F-box/LRR-repeat protein At3g28410 [Panicum virgatum]|uniref:putative F-box/LRR-repeat protein At3g28410 n=1 Tax=Panicum virgatum TaxID=38727 RepID=UPI0019D50978|nr:putative F-box/LRR-repeat protein At3g28410 [Panicum virgatum]
MKKRKAAEDGTPEPCRDRLSSLPDDLIGRILSLLPTPQAVLTSQLSRRWRRAWAHIAALNLSAVRDCARRGRGPRLSDLARGALLRFPTPGIPSVSVEINRSVYTADEWYRQAMERAVGSVRVASPCTLNGLELPPCARAEALAVRSPRTVLTLPDPAAAAPFGRLAELSLSLVQLGGGAARPLGEFLASCCPRLRTLRLCSVRGPALRWLVLRTDVLEVLDLSNVDDLTSLDVAATNLRCLSVRSCFRSPTGGDGEVAVSAPRIEAVRWHRSYPEQLIFRSDLASARQLGGPLRLPALGRRDQSDAPYTLQLLHACSQAHHLDLELVMPDETTLLNWLGPAEHGACEDLIRRVPQLPNASALSLKIRWGFGGGVAPSLASLLSRTPALTRLRVDASPYCFAVFEGDEPPPRPRGWQRWTSGVRAGDDGLRLDSLREVAVVGLKGEDPEEYRVLKLLLGSASPSLERVSLTFRDDAAASIVDEIATDVPTRFSMAAGRWKCCPPRVLTWIKQKLPTQACEQV